MRIAFHSEQLGLRGTEIALFDYAYYNREILYNGSLIISDRNSPNLQTLSRFEEHFPVVLYDDFSEVSRIVEREKVDSVYYMKSGQYDGKVVPNAQNLIHAVFQFHQPHGERHAYISQWLANKMGGEGYPHVPYMVDILKHQHQRDFRGKMLIPNTDLVFGYMGGRDSFNIEFAQKAVAKAVEQRDDLHFILLNVDAFVEHPRVHFFNGTADMEAKIAFINTCDACIHARDGGESFGLTVAEFSSFNKPIVTTDWCSGGLNDLAHLEMLGDKAIIYHSYDELLSIFLGIDRRADIEGKDWAAYSQYNPTAVMKQFEKVFLL